MHIENDASIILVAMINSTDNHDAVPPSRVKGRKGRISVADCIVQTLWGNGKPYKEWPSKTLGQLQEEVSRLANYNVGSSTVRATLYSHPELFVRAEKITRVQWKLAKGI
jgi:hypothetical protein